MITYEITEVPTFELRRIVHEGEKRRIGFVGKFTDLAAAQKFLDECKIMDRTEVEAASDA